LNIEFSQDTSIFDSFDYLKDSASIKKNFSSWLIR